MYRLNPSKGERFSLRRGRSTWLLAHIFAGTPLHVVQHVAGSLSGNTLTELLQYSKPTLDDDTAAVGMIRGLRRRRERAVRKGRLCADDARFLNNLRRMPSFPDSFATKWPIWTTEEQAQPVLDLIRRSGVVRHLERRRGHRPGFGLVQPLLDRGEHSQEIPENDHSDLFGQHDG